MTRIHGWMTCSVCLMDGVESLVVPLGDDGVCPRCGDDTGWARCDACQDFVNAVTLDEQDRCPECRQQARAELDDLRRQSAYR